MKYVFLSFSMGGLSGSPSYINNKVKWLKERGIETVAFDHFGSLNLKQKVVLEYLQPFQDNRIIELFFPPSYFTRHQRNKILDRLCTTIGASDNYVVESNSIRLALWGEMLSERLHAKHLLLFVGEHLSIKSEEEYHFLNFKLNRRELLTIKPQTVQNMFKGYRLIPDEEAQDYFFSASMGVKPEDVPMTELDNLPEADYKILSFGRLKPYFDNMINGIIEFAQSHKTRSINFLIMGDVKLDSKLLHSLGSVSNLFVKFIPPKRPIPMVIFDYSDVVIATSGCANIAFKAGAKTISMDVNTCEPLGIMGYTTVNSVYSSNPKQPEYDVCDLLEDVLEKRLYDGEPSLVRKPSNKGFKFQFGLINDDRLYWQGVDSINLDKGFRLFIETVVLRCRGVQLTPLFLSTR